MIELTLTSVWLKRVGEPDQWMLARTPPQSGRIYFFAMNRTFIDRIASESDHRRAKEIAQAALDGRTTVLEAVRALVSLAHTDAVADVEDRKFIIGIESETDHLPVGEVRKLWASFALKEKDVEIARAEELYRADFLETCRRIVQPHCPVDEFYKKGCQEKTSPLTGKREDFCLEIQPTDSCSSMRSRF